MARTLDQLTTRIRRTCLALPGVEETASWGHPNFRVRRGIFAALEDHQGRPSLAVRLGTGESDTFAADGRFFVPRAGGQPGWIGLLLDTQPPWSLVESLLEAAWRARTEAPGEVGGGIRG